MVHGKNIATRVLLKGENFSRMIIKHDTTLKRNIYINSVWANFDCGKHLQRNSFFIDKMYRIIYCQLSSTSLINQVLYSIFLIENNEYETITRLRNFC